MFTSSGSTHCVLVQLYLNTDIKSIYSLVHVLHVRLQIIVHVVQSHRRSTICIACANSEMYDGVIICFTIDKIILMQKPYGLLDIHFIIHYCVSLVTCSIIDNILVCVTIL